MTNDTKCPTCGEPMETDPMTGDSIGDCPDRLEWWHDRIAAERARTEKAEHDTAVAQSQYASADAALQESQRHLASAETRADALAAHVERLRRLVQHRSDCEGVDALIRGEFPQTCSCGLASVLAATPEGSLDEHDKRVRDAALDDAADAIDPKPSPSCLNWPTSTIGNALAVAALNIRWLKSTKQQEEP